MLSEFYHPIVNYYLGLHNLIRVGFCQVTSTESTTLLETWDHAIDYAISN